MKHIVGHRRRFWESLEIRQLLSTIYVDAGLTASTHDGTSWASAYTDLQQALTTASAGDQIDVAGGTYKPTTSTDRTATFQLQSGVAVYGGFAGSAATDPTMRNPVSYPTILSGDIGTIGDVTDNSYHVVTASGADATALLDGLTISDGFAANSSHTLGVGDSVANYGGGMYCNGSPTINDCTFVHNSTGNFDGLGGTGGAIAIAGSPNITDSRFLANSVTSTDFPSAGGAAYVFDGGSPNFVNCIFVGNSAYNGGAIGAQSSGAMILNNCDFTANSAAAVGGAIYVIQSGPTAANSIFWGNNAPSEPELGGMYPVTSSSAAITYSDVAGGFSGTGNIDADPQFTANPGPGADSIWGTTDDDFGNLLLQQTSPAIDAGDNAAVPTATTKDFAGNPRFLNVPAATDTGSGASPLVDMGAYETVPPALAIPGGPYTVIQSQSITLHGQGLSNVPGALQYAWDWSGNGLFTDATGPDPVFATTATTPAGTITVSLRVTNANNQSDIETTSIDIQPMTVTADPGGPYRVVQGGSITLNGSGVSNVPGDLQYAWDFTGNGLFTDATGATPTFTAPASAAPGPIAVSLRVTNANGGSDVENATINVVPSVVYVDPSALGANNGLNWTNALTSLTDALTQSAAGQTIRLAQGVYYPTTTQDRTATFNIPNGVEIDGGYGGFWSANPDSRQLDPNLTVLSGNIGNTKSAQDDSYHVVTLDGAGGGTVLDGLTIRDGYANGTGSQTNGGGLYLSSSSPTLRHCFILDNFAQSGGGGFYCQASSAPNITGCIIADNSAQGDGGAIRNDASSPVIVGSEITKNSAIAPTGNIARGGAIANFNGSAPSITKCSIDGNHANSGGAIYNSSSSPSFTDCTFIDNATSGAATQGGAILNDASSPSFTNCTFTANSAAVGGGIYDSNASAPTLINCILWGDAPGQATSEIASDAGSANVSYSDIQGAYTGQGNLNADPKFLANASAGADGIWGTTDDDWGSIHLQTSSPAIGAGASASGPVDMGRWAYSADPIVFDTRATTSTGHRRSRITFTAQATSPSTGEQPRKMEVYADSNGNLSLDASDALLGHAHHNKHGWTLNIASSKLQPGMVELFARASDKQSNFGPQAFAFASVPAEQPAIHKLSAKLHNSKKRGSILSLRAQGVNGPHQRVIFAVDTNHNSKFDAGDQLLSLQFSRKTNWAGVFATLPNSSYQFFARAQGTDGSWGPLAGATLET